eukprot:Nitzschia sp. Nitz4//scaffold232_size35869//9056//12145//NITZ4_007804-RA/size35869-processed-gene-0.17-mRNA-1//-1//CDS//3329543321//4354//frame0
MKRNCNLHVLSVLWWLTCLSHTSASTTAETRPGFNSGKDPQPRIIGGRNAEKNRFPYIVSLIDIHGDHSCGGTLIAPDMVLTASHCQGSIARAHVGRYNRVDANDDYEDIDVLSPVYPHPEYSSEGFPHDFLLLKLARASTKPRAILNSDSSIPVGGIEDELTVVGFGNTIYGVSSQSHILQEVNVSYIPNYICEQSKDARLGLTYQNQITDSMLCAGDSGEDSCQGDSGGPMVVLGESPTEDLLVGVISWGYGCALEAFPGVYARVSADYEWLRATICSVSDDAPAYLLCEETTVPVDTIPVTLLIQFDDFPQENGWSMRNVDSSEVYVSVDAGTYTEPRTREQVTVYLPAGATVELQVEDTFGDGLCCNNPGSYVLALGTDPDGTVLASGSGGFESTQYHQFTLPNEYNSSSSGETTIGDDEIVLTVVFQLDDYPTEVGWKIDNLLLDVENVITVPAGAYTTTQTKIIKSVVLEKDELYYFRMYDAHADGIDGGWVKLYLGTTEEDPDFLIFESDGDFDGGVDFTFLASEDADATLSPIVDGDAYLTLQLYLDLYPEEVGVQLRAFPPVATASRQDIDDGYILFFRPPRYYVDMPNQMVTERIPIPAVAEGQSQEFILIVTDSFSDGLCCGWNRTETTGYVLYEGKPSSGVIIVESPFIGGDREVSTFYIGTEEGTDDSSQREAELVDIKVTVLLDVFPDETGYYIEDLYGNRVVDVPNGTFTEQFLTVERNYSVPAGVYTFVLVDSFGDGINVNGVTYRVDVWGENDRPPVVAGTGAFVSREAHNFVLEDSTADADLSIQFVNDKKPREFGFYIERLDIINFDALVATVPQGSYSVSNSEITETIKVREGALYRVTFEDAGKDGIHGDIDISVSVPGFDPVLYTVNATSLSVMKAKLFVGELPNTASGSKTLEMRILFDDYPQEVEWMLVGDSGGEHSFRDQTVVAYGPTESYSISLANTESVETIAIPEHYGDRRFTLILTDSAGDGGMFPK